MQRILVIDSDNLAHRAFYATYRGAGQPVLQHAGFETNCIAGWSQMLATLIAQADPARVVFALDGGSDYRRSFYPDYKAGRAPKPEALKKQLPVLTDIVRNSGVQYLFREGEEADDLIMTFAAQSSGLAGVEILIASADKDFAQVVGKNVFQLKPEGGGRWDRMDAIRIQSSLGVEAHQVALYLALVGDEADNIPGIDLIGPGNAVKILTGKPSVEEVAVRVAAKKKWPLEKAVEQVAFNLKLTTYRDVADSTTTRGNAPGVALDQLEQLNCQHALRIWRRMIQRFGTDENGASAAQGAVAPARVSPPLRAVQGELVLA